MWNQMSSSSSSSENKKNTQEVDVDDCECSGSSDGGIEQQPQQTVQQQLQHHHQQQPAQKNNSKNHKQLQENIPTSSAIASESQKLDGAEEAGSNKFLEAAFEEGVDSGFLSGPQTSSLIVSESEEGAAAGSEKKLNIPGSGIEQQQQQPQHKQYQQQQYDLDSGCITTEDIVSEELQQQQQQSATASTNEQMLLKDNVEGMSEWFCRINLQNNPSSNTTTQPQQQQASNIPSSSCLNNLDAPKSRPIQKPPTSPSCTSLPASYPATNMPQTAQQPQQQRQTTTASNNLPPNLTPANAWEYYYQQNDDGDTPLHLACISGYVDVVAALIRMAPHPCLFNIQNDEAQTPLHLATLTAQPKIIRMLLIAGAEPIARDRHGNTALHLACISGEEQCVRALTIPISHSEVNEAHKQYGHRSNDKSFLKIAKLPSDLEIRNYDGERCVHLAANAGFINILRILVLYGADINAREGKSGRTPLHIAIECCNEDLANYLLEDCQTSLDLETATYAGLTAYQVAGILNKSEMQDILEKRGAEPLTPPDSDYDSSDVETDLDDSKLYDRFGDPGYFVGYGKGANAMTVA